MRNLLIAIIIGLTLLSAAVSQQTRLPQIIAPPPISDDTPTPTSTATATTQPAATNTPTVTPTVTATTAPDGPCPCNADLRNCTDFATHSQAQACFDFCVSQGKGDVHHLDSDGDGDACESLPGGFTVLSVQ